MIKRNDSEDYFTSMFDQIINHQAITIKNRTQMLTDKIFQITEQTGVQLIKWLNNSNDHHKEYPEEMIIPETISG